MILYKKDVFKGMDLMARILDTAFFSSITFLAFFVALSFSGKDVRLTALVALTGAFCVTGIIPFLQKRKPFLSFGRKKRFASFFVKRLIYEDGKDAHIHVFEALSKKYPIEKGEFQNGILLFDHGSGREKSILCVLQKLKASSDDLLSLWRRHGKASRVRAMVIAIPGKCERDVYLRALSLSDPKVVIVDRSMLKHLAMKIKQNETPAAKKNRFRPLRTMHALLSGKRAGYFAPPAILFLLYYLLTGSFVYLIFGCVLFGAFIYSLFLKKGKPTLF